MRGLEQIYIILRKSSDAIEKVLKFITAILLLLCSFSVFLQVVNRYILVKQTLFPWRSISWTDELSRLLMVTLAYLAMGLCYKHGQLSRADMVYTRLNGKAKYILYYLECLIIGIFLVYAIKYGIEFALANKIYRSESLSIPGNVLYMIPVVGFVLMFYQVIVEVVGVIAGKIRPFDSLVKDEEVE